MPKRRTFHQTESGRVFGHRQKTSIRAGLYARVSTHDQQTLSLQRRAMREDAARCDWTIAVDIREVGSGASVRELRQKVIDAARRRDIDVVIVWRLDRWGRSMADLAAVESYVEKKGESERPIFRDALTDLNGDGRDDAIVLLLGGSWCGSGGCNMLVLRGTEKGFTVVSESTITSEPIRFSPEKVQGWRTLIVFSKGKGDVLMRFNGTRYPLNPSTQPKATPAQVNTAQVVMKPFVPK